MKLQYQANEICQARTFIKSSSNLSR